MRKFLLFNILFSALLVLFPAFLFPQQVSLTILHTNDIHSHLLPFDYPSTVSPESELAPIKMRSNIGGIARRTTLVTRIRQDLASKGATLWLVDSGDFSEGTPFSLEYHGSADAAAMNAAEYSFGTLGNHEFNNSLAGLKSLLRLFQYPVLCANVRDRVGALLTEASEIRSLGPLKIGIFGLLARTTSGYPAAREGLAISGEIETARRLVKALRSKADIIVILSHCGEKMDRRIAEEVSGIDIIVGGHSHSRIPFGEIVWNSQKGKTRDTHGTVVVQAHQWGGELGRLDIQFEKNARGIWQVIRHHASLIPVTPDIPEDKTVAAVVDHYWKPIAARYNEIIGKAAADFVDNGIDLTAYNLMADSVRESFGTEIALENIGGVRAPLLKGTITLADLAAMDPFDNTVVTFRISGRSLKKLLQSERPAVSGLHYRIEGNTVTEVSVAGAPMIEDRMYTGATNSYVARTALKGIEKKESGKQRRDVLTEYIRKKGIVHPLRDNRRSIEVVSK
jgi:5'-nucleotidase/UDP-sugar diphosphatase